MRSGRFAVILGVLLAAGVGAHPDAARGSSRWIGTWTTAQVGRPQSPPPSAQPAAPVVQFKNQTLRQIVHASIGGPRVRMAIGNTFGTAPLSVGAVAIARRGAESTIVPGSARALTFSGRPAVTIPPGAMVYSDAADLVVPSSSDLVVDLYLPGDTNTPSPLSLHAGARATSYASEAGNHAGAIDFPVAAKMTSWFLLERVEVAGTGATSAVVAFGDSITDGTASSIDANRRWPDRLAARLAEAHLNVGVLNAGIGGNRILADATTYSAGVNAEARFDRDVLTQSGATDVIVLEGINDIGLARADPTPDADDLIAADEQLITRAHARGLRIYGATLTPFEGARYFTPEGEAKRQALNRWIRTSHAFDGVIDFDAAARDPGQTGRLRAEYDSGDHLHPNDAGYRAMADAVDLGLFRHAPAVRRTATNGGADR